MRDVFGSRQHWQTSILPACSTWLNQHNLCFILLSLYQSFLVCFHFCYVQFSCGVLCSFAEICIESVPPFWISNRTNWMSMDRQMCIMNFKISAYTTHLGELNLILQFVESRLATVNYIGARKKILFSSMALDTVVEYFCLSKISGILEALQEFETDRLCTADWSGFSVRAQHLLS